MMHLYMQFLKFVDYSKIHAVVIYSDTNMKICNPNLFIESEKQCLVVL